MTHEPFDESEIHAYLSGRLDGDALANFETRLLEDPTFLEEVRAAELLAEGVRANAEYIETELPSRSWLNQRPSQLATAAIVLLGVSLAYTALNSESPQDVSLANRVVLESFRNGANTYVHVLEAPYVVLEIYPGPSEQAFVLTLLDHNENPVADLGQQQTLDDDSLIVVLRDIPAGKYFLDITNPSLDDTRFNLTILNR